MRALDVPATARLDRGGMPWGDLARAPGRAEQDTVSYATGVPANGRQFAREPGQKPNPDPVAARQPPARLR